MLISKMNYEKPFLKWVGGKTQIINKIIPKFPKKINNYYELFLGGGSVLFALCSKIKNKEIEIDGNIYAFDINEGLINVYKAIQSNKDELYNYITHYMKMYESITGETVNRKPETETDATTSKESYYYWMRARFNKLPKTSIEYSALFIILNKLCFRGVYREGPNGFNVPYGHYKKTPTIISESQLTTISELIKDVKFESLGFKESISKIKSNDFVYLDPPYAPLDKNSFVNYTKDGFTLENHIELFKKIIELKDVKFIMSNAKVELVLDYFKDFTFEEIIARRAIHSKDPGSKALEILIMNL